jgi:hypothetical protein
MSYWDYDDYNDRVSYGYNWRTSWKSSKYNSWWETSNKEEHDDLFVKEHVHYQTPASVELSRYVSHDGNAVKECKELCRFFFYKMINNKDYIEDKYTDFTKLSETEMQEVTNKKAVFDKLWDTDIPGFSAKDKAIYVMQSLKDCGGKIANKLSNLRDESIEALKICDDIFWDAIYNELLNENLTGDYTNKLQVLKNISLIKNFGSKFKIEKEVEEKQVANSHLHAVKMMKDLSQVYNVELYQRLLPNYFAKLATKDLLVTVPIDKTEHKQKIIMVVDYSGSMNEMFKQNWVKAILIERLALAIKEECEIFFSYFLNRLEQFQFTHIYDKKTALAFWKTFSTQPSGGNTALGSVVDEIARDINIGKLHNLDIDLRGENIELLAIGDGQDSAGQASFKWKTNVIALFQSNEEVKKMCLDNKGMYIYIKDKVQIYE